MASSTNRIEKKTVLRAPRARVWRAITDSREFGDWFGVKLEGPFRAGTSVRGKITSKGYENTPMEMWVEAIEPETRFSYRWHPYAIDPAADFSKEPTTLVEFVLADAEGGTLLVITETGFDDVPLARRAKAFESNSEGWSIQCQQIAKYLDAK